MWPWVLQITHFKRSHLNNSHVCLGSVSGMAAQGHQTSGTERIDAAQPTRCITFVWKRVNSLENTKERVSLLRPFMHIKSEWRHHYALHIEIYRSELIRPAWLQVWGLFDCSAKTGHHKHPAESWTVPHHGGFWHMLLHQHLQRGELGICQGSEGAVLGRHRRELKRSSPKYLPWTHPPACAQHHRQHGSVRDRMTAWNLSQCFHHSEFYIETVFKTVLHFYEHLHPIILEYQWKGNLFLHSKIIGLYALQICAVVPSVALLPCI